MSIVARNTPPQRCTASRRRHQDEAARRDDQVLRLLLAQSDAEPFRVCDDSRELINVELTDEVSLFPEGAAWNRLIRHTNVNLLTREQQTRFDSAIVGREHRREAVGGLESRER